MGREQVKDGEASWKKILKGLRITKIEGQRQSEMEANIQQ